MVLAASASLDAVVVEWQPVPVRNNIERSQRAKILAHATSGTKIECQSGLGATVIMLSVPDTAARSNSANG